MSNSFLLGAVAMASLVAAMFFLRFWRRTGDRFFLLFALAFLIDAIGRAAMELAGPLANEHEPLYYLGRLVMFGLIAFAIVGKNTAARGSGDREEGGPPASRRRDRAA